MKQNIILIVLFLLLPACNRSAPQVDREVESTHRIDGPKHFDFEVLLAKIKNCNDKELAYFYRHWKDIHKQLEDASNEGLLADLPLNQQTELWDALSLSLIHI